MKQKPHLVSFSRMRFNAGNRMLTNLLGRAEGVDSRLEGSLEQHPRPDLPEELLPFS